MPYLRRYGDSIGLEISLLARAPAPWDPYLDHQLIRFSHFLLIPALTIALSVHVTLHMIKGHVKQA